METFLKCGVDEAINSGALHFLGHWQVQESHYLALMSFLFFEQNQCLGFWSLLFLVTPQEFCHWSAVLCQPYHPEEVLLCQRTRTSIKLKLKWPEPTIQEVLLVL